MIKLIITSIIIFIAIILLLLMLNVKIEYFSNNIFISKTYNILKDSSGNNINPKIWYKLDNTNFTDDEMGLVNLTNLRNCTPNTTDFIKGNASLQFTGRSSLESRPTTLFGDSTFSISVWVKLWINLWNGNSINFNVATRCIRAVIVYGRINREL